MNKLDVAGIPCSHIYDLNRYLNQEAKEMKMAEEREAQIEERAKDLMVEGESCDPYGMTIHKGVNYVYYNLFEALSEMPEAQQKFMSEQWWFATKQSNDMKAKLFDELDKIVRAYWFRTARHIADGEIGA